MKLYTITKDYQHFHGGNIVAVISAASKKDAKELFCNKNHIIHSNFSLSYKVSKIGSSILNTRVVLQKL